MDVEHTERLLEMVERRAPGLLSVGVRELVLPDGLTLRLETPLAMTPVSVPKDLGQPAPVAADLTDPLNDPATFGGQLPGYARLADDEDDT